MKANNFKTRSRVKVLIGIAIIASLAVLGASCGDDDDDSTPRALTNDTQQISETSATTAPPPPAVDNNITSPDGNTTPGRVSPEPNPAAQKDLSITIRNGNAEARSRTNEDLVYSLDDDIIISVDTDVDGEVHIHTYDDSFFILEGAPVTYEFYPHIAGEFLIELEETSLELATITIR